MIYKGKQISDEILLRAMDKVQMPPTAMVPIRDYLFRIHIDIMSTPKYSGDTSIL